MPDYDYVIVGGGMVAASAASAIHDADAAATIAILSADVDAPYARPALSKKLWTDPEFTEDDVPLGAEESGADIRLAIEVTALSPTEHTVTTADGTRYGYRRLLLATGGVPRTVDGLEAGDRVLYYRSYADYRRLRALADGHATVAVVGGSYIGTEIAASLVQNGCSVVLVTPDDVLGGSVFPPDLAARFHSLFTDAGVSIRSGVKVEGGEAEGETVRLRLDDGSVLEADAAVVGLGIDPATGLAEEAGLDVEDGVVVDERLRTSATDVYAAGDVASYPDAILGRRRVEHVDNAQAMGDAAGRLLAGSDEPYTHTPYYYSVVFGVRYEAVGRLDASLETVERWETPLEKGIVYYVEDGHPVGVLDWNVDEDEAPARRDAARAVLASGVLPPE